MIMDPPWRGVEGELLSYNDTRSLMHRCIAYGLELARGEVGEVEVKVVQEDRNKLNPTTRFQAVHSVDQRLVKLIRKLEQEVQ